MFGLDYSKIGCKNMKKVFNQYKIDGEVYISIDDVIDNAKIYKKSFDDEFKRVLVHGLLHLIGYNDDTVKQKEDMRILEDKYILLIKEEIISISWLFYLLYY